MLCLVLGDERCDLVMQLLFSLVSQVRRWLLFGWICAKSVACMSIVISFYPVLLALVWFGLMLFSLLMFHFLLRRFSSLFLLAWYAQVLLHLTSISLHVGRQWIMDFTAM